MNSISKEKTMVMQLFIIIFEYKLSRLPPYVTKIGITFSSLCYVKFTHNSFVEYFVHILSKVSEAKKKSKRAKKGKKNRVQKKIIRPTAFDHSVAVVRLWTKTTN